MKYVVLLGDGMADLPHEYFGGKTVLQASDIPTMNRLADCGELGLVDTVTKGYPPGSDVTNLSLLGYDPRRYYTGRAPLEAANMGVALAPDETAFRCNVVTLKNSDGVDLMDDYSAGHITTDSAKPLIELMDAAFRDEGARFYPGKSYRHLCVLKDVESNLSTTPPHDIMNQPVSSHLPQGPNAERLNRLMKKSREIFSKSSHNLSLKTPVTQIWLWGQGGAPSMPSFKNLCGLQGAVVSAVDLIQGIGTLTGMSVLRVPGATGFLDTNYEGKVSAAVEYLKQGGDFIYLHVEAPDECGHNGIPADKKRAVEDFDREVVTPIYRFLKAQGDFRLLILPDHFTPLAMRTHLGEPVPYILVSKGDSVEKRRGGYSESTAKAAGVFIPSGMDLFRKLVGQ